LTGEEGRPFLLVAACPLQIMRWWVRPTLPAATQPSPAWYATGQRRQRIMRPGGRGFIIIVKIIVIVIIVIIIFIITNNGVPSSSALQ
jgi:hypothetical protein